MPHFGVLRPSPHATRGPRQRQSPDLARGGVDGEAGRGRDTPGMVLQASPMRLAPAEGKTWRRATTPRAALYVAAYSPCAHPTMPSWLHKETPE